MDLLAAGLEKWVCFFIILNSQFRSVRIEMGGDKRNNDADQHQLGNSSDFIGNKNTAPDEITTNDKSSDSPFNTSVHPSILIRRVRNNRARLSVANSSDTTWLDTRFGQIRHYGLRSFLGERQVGSRIALIVGMP